MNDEVKNAFQNSRDASHRWQVTRRAALQIGGLSGFAMLMSACTPGGDSSSSATSGGKAESGGSIVWAIDSDPASLAPFGMTNTSGEYVKNLIYESLVTWNPDLKVLPALATTWEVPDEKTYIFHLRKGVTFHDGQPFTADDVKYSFDSQKTPPPPGSTNLQYPKIADVEVVDPHTVKFVMGQPDGTVLGYCASLKYSYICSKDMYDKLDPSHEANGTGSFKLDKYVPNAQVSLAKNTKYWDKKKPRVDKVTLKVLTDMQSVVSGITSGAVDGGFVDADSSRILQSNKNVQILEKPSVAFRELEWTIKPDDPWADVRVRQAINYAIDRDTIIKNVYAGKATYSSKVPPSYGDWAIPIKELTSDYQKHDLAKAKALMKEAGFASGFSVTAQALASPNDYVKVAQVVAEQLKKINIKMKVQPLEIGVFGANNGSGNFQWQFTGRGMRGDVSGYFTDFDPTTSTYKAWFAGGYKNDDLTALINQGLGETDDKKRHQIYTKMQQIVLTEWGTVPLVAPTQFQAQRKRVHDMPIAIGGTMRYLNQAWVSA